MASQRRGVQPSRAEQRTAAAGALSQRLGCQRRVRSRQKRIKAGRELDESSHRGLLGAKGRWGKTVCCRTVIARQTERIFGAASPWISQTSLYGYYHHHYYYHLIITSYGVLRTYQADFCILRPLHRQQV